MARMSRPPLLEYTEAGLYCARGDFYIDPQRVAANAIVTHGHADHARAGMKHYLCHTHSAPILRQRLGRKIAVQTVAYGEPVTINGVRVSLHPAGHLLGSAQVRVAYGGDVWVASGDYALLPDATCVPFEPVPCRVFITETTFGLPIYRWPNPADVFAAINRWWRQNASDGVTSVMYAYSLGKAQRIMAGVDAAIGPILTHDAVEQMTACYRASGVTLPPTRCVARASSPQTFAQALMITPSAGARAPWMEQCARVSTAFASGWMHTRKGRKHSGFDRGFVLSDHADWDGLITAIRCSQAETVWATHGSHPAFVRWLQERGIETIQVS
jgi:putative mRNA 3-end processing factor